MKYSLLILYFWVFSINAQEALTVAQWRDILSGSIPTYKRLSIKNIALYHQGQLLYTYQLLSTPEGYLKITTPERGYVRMMIMANCSQPIFCRYKKGMRLLITLMERLLLIHLL